ncbi:MAG: hypothetical protein QGF46_01780 [Planctomycetota bacterium]|nr:hypothetical protein [Planctomycetota bacterium]
MQVLVGDGCGNRFALVEGSAMKNAKLTPGLLIHQCQDLDIDGLLVLNGIKLEIFNLDGSDGGACFNGMRMAAIASGLDDGEFTMSGQNIKWQRLDDQIELLLPYSEQDFELAELEIDGYMVSTVSFSNPHAIVKNYDGYEQDFAERLQADADHFPNSVNVEFVKSPYSGEEISARIFERGVGETMACGTAAVALAIDAWSSGMTGEITVKTWGGSLFLKKSEQGKISLRGEARVTGNIDLELA